MKLNGKKTPLILLAIVMSLLFLASCDKKDDPPTAPTIEYGHVAGFVSATGRAPLPGVTVKIGTKTTLTDSNGLFYISEIGVGNSVLIDFSKSGFISNQKVVNVQSGQTSYINNTMFQPNTQTFSPLTENLLYDSWHTIGLPENAFVDANGNLFTGTVKAEMKFFDPTQADQLNAFPGTFSGIQTDGMETMFESYGFLSATFTDNANPANVLKLDQGKQAFIRTLIPYSLQEYAPSSIPLWYYDTSDGKWKQQGSATLNGEYYEGYVDHFSFWNFDHPINISDQATITGRVVFDDGTLTPVAGAQVVATGINYTGYTTATTNAQGLFEVSVKALSQVKLQAFAGTNSSAFTPTIHSPAGGVIYPYGDIAIANMDFRMIGKLLASNGNPIANAYGMLSQVNPPANELSFSAWINTDSEGNFSYNYTYPYPGTSFNVQFYIFGEPNLFSVALPFTVPQPGGIKDFGNVTLVPGGYITGRLKISGGDYLSEGYVSFNQEGATGEGSHFSSDIDETGRFTIQGPPSTSLTNMRANVYVNSTNYGSSLITLNFPASNATNDIGTINLSPRKK